MLGSGKEKPPSVIHAAKIEGAKRTSELLMGQLSLKKDCFLQVKTSYKALKINALVKISCSQKQWVNFYSSLCFQQKDFFRPEKYKALKINALGKNSCSQKKLGARASCSHVSEIRWTDGQRYF